MANTALNLAKRLRPRSVSLPHSFTQPAVFSKHLNIEAAKQRTADWEPTINLTDLKPRNPDEDNNSDDPKLACVPTYSTFDPGAPHPLLLSSSLPLSASSLVGDQASTASAPGPVVTNSSLQTPSTASGLHHAIEIQQASPAVSTLEMSKPWPYSLPRGLRPKAGTTYDMMYGDGVGDGGVKKVKLGVLQKVLYGVPEPGREDGGEE